MNLNATARQDMFQEIQALDFGLVDINLYLDTHPNDTAALNFYHRHVALLDQLTYEYINQYGPLTVKDVVSTNRWTWIDNPWPWEMEA